MYDRKNRGGVDSIIVATQLVWACVSKAGQVLCFFAGSHHCHISRPCILSYTAHTSFLCISTHCAHFAPFFSNT